MSGTHGFGGGLSPIADQRFIANFSGGTAIPGATEIVAGANIVLTPTTTSQLIIAATTGSTASGTVVVVNTGTGLTGGPITSSGTVSLAAFNTGFFLANFSGASAAPIPVSLTVGSGITYSAVTDSVTVSLAPIADQRILANYSGGSLAPQAVQLLAGSGITFSGVTTSLTITATTPTPAVVLISELTAAGLTASFNFTSIVSTYRDLEVRFRGRGDTALNDVGVRTQFNGDTGSTNYTYQQIFGAGTVAGVQDNSDPSILWLQVPAASTVTAGFFGAGTLIVFGYTTSFFKQVATIGGQHINSSGQRTLATSGEWQSTSAVTSVLVFPSAGNFITGSICSLYGHL